MPVILSEIQRRDLEIARIVAKIEGAAAIMERDGRSLNPRGAFILLREEFGKIGINIPVQK